MLGISTYKPIFHTTAESFKSDFEQILSELIGKRIERFWIMWNTKENEWLTDGPIILGINGKKFEFTAYQLDEFSLTINSFELTDTLDWYGMGAEMPLIWKENGHSDLIKKLNKEITGINILTYNFLSESVKTGEKYETGAMLTGIEFVLKKVSESDNENFFSIYNNLDENGVETTEVNHGNQIKRIKITNQNTI